jgi:D-tyrosyl-tRNA(Tyr) deacylase
MVICLRNVRGIARRKGGRRIMRAVVQRVKRASVKVDGSIRDSISRGILVLVGVEKGDDVNDIEYIASKVTGMRVFEDREGKMNLDVKEACGSLLIVSQFTLHGDLRKGRRPSFSSAERPERAKGLFDTLIKKIEERGVKVGRGEFQTRMDVELVNDGPVTILLDSRKGF